MLLTDQSITAELPAEYAVALIERCIYTLQSDTRKRNAWNRWLIYTEQHTPLIRDRILTTHNDPGIRAEIDKFVDLTVNPGLDVTRQTSVCWRQGARRSIEGIDEDQLAAFHELVIESRIDTLAPAWNEIAAFVGPLIVVPAVRKGTLRWDTLLATFAEVATDPEDRHGQPLAAAWSMRVECETNGKATATLLDDQAWTTYESVQGQTKPDGSVMPPQTSISKTLPHSLGYFPGVVLRFDSVFDGDWWGSPYLNQRLVDATVAIGLLNASLAFVRKAQNKKLLAIVGDLSGFPSGQVLDAEAPITSDVPPNSGPAPAINVLDFDTDPSSYIKHAAFIYRNIANAYGGQVEADEADGSARVSFSVEALAEIRNKQIPHARTFERDLWAAAVDMCRKLRHPLAARLPTREQVLAGFRIDFGKLSRKFADPAAEQQWLEFLMAKGASDQIEIIRAQGNSTLNDQQIRDLAETHLENQSWFNTILATRNLSLIDGKVASTAQANGAMGPAVRDGTPLVIEGAAPMAQGADGFAAGEPAEAEPAQAEKPEIDPTVGDVQAAALNGAQMAGYMSLGEKLGAGLLPIEFGERFLPIAFPGVVKDEAAARYLLEPLRNFVPRPQAGTPNESSDNADAGADAPEMTTDDDRRDPGTGSDRDADREARRP